MPAPRRKLPPGKGAQPGEQRALRTGARAKLPVGDVAQATQDFMEALNASVPLRDADGNAPASDRIAIEVVAAALARYRYLSASFAHLTNMGNRRLRYNLIRELRRTEKQLISELREFGLTPAGRVKLGLNLARTAEAIHHAQPVRNEERAKVMGELMLRNGMIPRADVIDGQVTEQE